jgi:DNA (cytosine-5)-methyltransferase 1
MLTAVSLFAGVGGFDLALERSGAKVVASVEWDKKAQEVLRRHFPQSTIFGDITGVTGEQLIAAGFEPSNGIITGGFPCQDLSVAGKRAGLGGSRSGLFWEICRLLDETRAQNFILENVPGLLSSNQGKDMAAVLEALVERGYRIAWRVLDAQHFGVPQRRRRVFIVGSLGNSGKSPAEILAIAESRAGYLAAGCKSRKSSTTTTAGSPTTVGTLLARDHKGIDQISVEENKLVLFDAPESVTPFSPSDFANYAENKDISATLRADGGDLGGGSETLLVFDPHRSDGVRIQGETVNTLTSMMGTGGNNMPMVAYSMHGAMIGRNDEAGPKGSGFFGENEPSYTLTASAQARHGVVTVADSTSMVRKLTPVECERLQGFPDGWTDGQTDGHRYKQMGNAVAVPVVEWIIQNICDTV